MIGKISFNGGYIKTSVGKLPVKCIQVENKESEDPLKAETMNKISTGDVLEISEVNSSGPITYDVWVCDTHGDGSSGEIHYLTCNPKLTRGTLEYDADECSIKQKDLPDKECRIISVADVASLVFEV